MIQSMTGFGRAVLILPQKKITVDVKSLNSNVPMLAFVFHLHKEKELSIRSFSLHHFVEYDRTVCFC